MDMKKNIIQVLISLFAVIMLMSCSLFKVSISTGDPMTKKDANTRIMTRGFYHEMSSEITNSADSIASLTADVNIKVRAIRWKIGATRAAVTAVMQSLPEVALADLWILCKRMDSSLLLATDSLLFGEYSCIARHTTERLNQKVVHLAKDLLTVERYSLMTKFVDKYIAENSMANDKDLSTNTTYAWFNFLKENGLDDSPKIGTIAEVMSDVSDKLDGQAMQISNSISWSKDIIDIRIRQDSTKSQLQAQLEELENNFNRMVVVMENIPAISDSVVNNLNSQMHKLIYSMNSSVDNAFLNIDMQREEIQRFISLEREQLVKDSKKSANEVVANVLDALPALVGQVVLYIILLVVVLFGVPFILGFWMGGLRQKIKNRKKPL